MLGYFYDLLDRPPSPRHKSDRLRLLVEKLNLRRFLKFLHTETWDVIVNTHFLPAEMIAALAPQRRHRHAAPDRDHRFRDASPVGQSALRPLLHGHRGRGGQPAHWGVPSGDITVTGIPIHPAFSEPKDRAECQRRQGITGDRPVLLQLAGGFGVGPVEMLFQSILQVETPLELVVVAGRNAELKDRLEKIEVPARHVAHVLGFTTEMDELMAAADLLISKPGGLTTSEALARGTPMAVVNPIPGQESRNSDFLLENAAAIKVNNVATLPYKLNQLLASPDRLAQLTANAKRLGRPRAAFDVAQAALNWVDGKKF